MPAIHDANHGISQDKIPLSMAKDEKANSLLVV